MSHYMSPNLRPSSVRISATPYNEYGRNPFV